MADAKLEVNSLKMQNSLSSYITSSLSRAEHHLVMRRQELTLANVIMFQFEKSSKMQGLFKEMKHARSKSEEILSVKFNVHRFLCIMVKSTGSGVPSDID
jgi:hypothetical protein